MTKTSRDSNPSRSPDVQEDVDPVEDDIWDLGRDADVEQEVGGVGLIGLCVLFAQFKADEILKFEAGNLHEHEEKTFNFLL